MKAKYTPNELRIVVRHPRIIGAPFAFPGEYTYASMAECIRPKDVEDGLTQLVILPTQDAYAREIVKHLNRHPVMKTRLFEMYQSRGSSAQRVNCFVPMHWKTARALADLRLADLWTRAVVPDIAEEIMGASISDLGIWVVRCINGEA